MHILVIGASVTLDDVVQSVLGHADIGSETKVVKLHVRRSGIGTNHLMGFFLDAPRPGAREFERSGLGNPRGFPDDDLLHVDIIVRYHDLGECNWASATRSAGLDVL